jgi:anti-sigma B factor antagonist
MNRLESGAVVTESGQPTGVQVIALEGELDLANVRQLDYAIEQGIDRGALDFIADLSDVEFVDATAIHALLRGWKRAARRNGRFVLVKPTDRIWRVFVLTGVARTFATFGSQREARAYLASSHN